jgi:two-component system, NarL family, sensor histidine kinase DevS
MTVRPGPKPGERRRAERTTERASDDLVGAVVRLMPDAAIVVDHDGSIVAANALAETVFGYLPGALTGEVVDRLVPERLRSGHGHRRSTYTAEPSQRPMGAGLDLWARRQDGSEFPVDISLAPLGVPERPLTLAAVRDLTQRRTEWAALGRLAAIVSASYDAIVSTDLVGNVTSWNSGAQRLLGYSSNDIVNRSILRLVAADQHEVVESKIEQVRAGIRVARSDTRRLRKDGVELDVSESVSLIRGPSGDPIGLAWLISDITERKDAELALRQLLSETQRRERWLEAISDIRLSLLGGGRLSEWLEMIAKRVCEVTDSDDAAIFLEGDRPDSVSPAATEGERFSSKSTRSLPVRGSPFGYVLSTGETWSSSGSAGTVLDAAGVYVVGGPVMVVALTNSQGTRGFLAVSRAKRRPVFDSEDVRMVESFTQQAGLAVEIAQAFTVREQFALVADRERIARDLHDHVIQRLFAVGMALQAASNSVTDTKMLERINGSVEELDATIRDVRSTIFSLELRATERAETSPRSQLLDVASKAAAGLGFQPRLQFDGPVDTRIPEELIPDMVAVVRETLSNAARHARASNVEVHVRAHDHLEIVVSDDGRGLGKSLRLSGLANLRARAERRGGSMSVDGDASYGTRVEWRVPLGQ